MAQTWHPHDKRPELLKEEWLEWPPFEAIKGRPSCLLPGPQVVQFLAPPPKVRYLQKVDPHPDLWFVYRRRLECAKAVLKLVQAVEHVAPFE
ncbi:hypothetical protein KPB2_5533 [Klebsiella pneumoniae Kb677]|nr:hypothetical protein KPB2_5533 [Klebsiella pneumoniae Kb677]